MLPRPVVIAVGIAPPDVVLSFAIRLLGRLVGSQTGLGSSSHREPILRRPLFFTALSRHRPIEAPPNP